MSRDRTLTRVPLRRSRGALRRFIRAAEHQRARAGWRVGRPVMDMTTTVNEGAQKRRRRAGPARRDESIHDFSATVDEGAQQGIQGDG